MATILLEIVCITPVLSANEIIPITSYGASLIMLLATVALPTVLPVTLNVQNTWPISIPLNSGAPRVRAVTVTPPILLFKMFTIPPIVASGAAATRAPPAIIPLSVGAVEGAVNPVEDLNKIFPVEDWLPMVFDSISTAPST